MSQPSTNDLAQQYREFGRPYDWFEKIYANANDDACAVPWANLAPSSDLVEWLHREQPNAADCSALVIGCGLGDDAEALAQRGFTVTAFDVSPTAIDWCHRRFPISPVKYHVIDLFETPADWQRSFDFVLEYRTLQALPPETNRQAIEAIARLVGPGGKLLVICLGSIIHYNFNGPPWPLHKETLDHFQSLGLEEVSCEEYGIRFGTPVRTYRIQYQAGQELSSLPDKKLGHILPNQLRDSCLAQPFTI